ncbi:MAG: ribonuclease HII [Candidatus Marinamargulisbacteria bacterium]
MPNDLTAHKSSALIAGIDEAGRGALAGPVVACCVAFKSTFKNTALLNDSKQLSVNQRFDIYNKIRPYIYLGVGMVTHRGIDQMNILNATLLAMQKCARRCPINCDHIIIDGNRRPNIPGSIETMVKADQLIDQVKAASICAKVLRDRCMVRYHARYPEYEFHRHKGYGTKQHYVTLFQQSPSPIHRKSFNLNHQLSLFDNASLI